MVDVMAVKTKVALNQEHLWLKMNVHGVMILVTGLRNVLSSRKKGSRRKILLILL